MSSPTEMTATVVFRVGPVKATFGGKVTLSDLDPPNSYRISGEGSGGVAGFAKGGATVQLEAEGPDMTVLHYDVDAQIGGSRRSACYGPELYRARLTCQTSLQVLQQRPAKRAC